MVRRISNPRVLRFWCPEFWCVGGRVFLGGMMVSFGDVYLDNASTSYPKPSFVADVVASYLRDAGCSPGRSGHRRGRRSEETVGRARQVVAEILGCQDHRRIAYTHNATLALNTAIKGILRPGDHVVTTCYEHNSVLRPLERLVRRGTIEYTAVGPDRNGILDVQAFQDAFRPNTRLAVMLLSA